MKIASRASASMARSSASASSWALMFVLCVSRRWRAVLCPPCSLCCVAGCGVARRRKQPVSLQRRGYRVLLLPETDLDVMRRQKRPTKLCEWQAELAACKDTSKQIGTHMQLFEYPSVR